MSMQQDKKGRWLVRWKDKETGKHRSRLFGPTESDKQQAIQFDLGQAKQRRHDKYVRAAITISEICNEYHNRHQRSDSTVDNDDYKLSRCILPLLGRKPAEFITTRDIDIYVAERMRTVKRTTIARELRLLKAVFTWSENQDPPLILKNPIRNYRLDKLDQREASMPPTVEEIRRLIAHSAPHLARAIKIFWFTGIRPGRELFGITWQDVDFANHEIRVRDTKEVRQQRVRFVPMVVELEEELQRLLVEDQFKIQKGRKTEEELRKARDRVWMTPVVHWRFQRISTLKRAWREAKEDAGITRPLRLYDLRHAFASNALRAGADLKSISEILGHSRPDTTLREYQHVVREQHRDAVELIPSLAAKPADVVSMQKARRKKGEPSKT